MSKTWGPSCWFLFHSLATKVKDEEFANLKTDIWNMITSICMNLPCPECRMHATRIINSANKSVVLASRVNLEKYLFDFHNSVNQRKRYKIFTWEEYTEKYKSANIVNIAYNFVTVFNQSTRNSRMITDSFHRQIFIKRFISWFEANKQKFNGPSA